MSDLQQKLLALRHVASQISADEDIESLLPDLVKSTCEQGGWDRGTVMSIDLEHGYALVVTRHETSMLTQQLEDRWELATSPALVALKQGTLVYIRDALETTQFPGYRREAQERGYRSVMVVPMSCLDAQGRPMVLTVASRNVRDLGADDSTFMSAAVHLGSIAVDRAHRHRLHQQTTERLQQGLEAQRSLLRDVLAGASMESLASSLHELLNGPVLVIDFVGNNVLGSRPPGHDTFDDDAWNDVTAGAAGRELVSTVREALQVYRKSSLDVPLGKGGRAIAAALEPLTVDKELVGALLTFDPANTSDLQLLMVESARFALSVHLMRSVVRFRAETRTLSELFFEIVERRWRDEGDVIGRSRRLGLPVDGPMQMVVIDFQGGDLGHGGYLPMGSQAIVDLVGKQFRVPMSVITLGSGLVCLLRRDDGLDEAAVGKLAHRISQDLARTLNREPIVVLGEICEGLERIAIDWEHCWRVIRVARKLGRTGVLDIPSFGAVPMLAGAVDSAELRSFVEGTIGKLLEHDQKSPSSMYLETLSQYLRSGCRSQACADAMGLHVTTLRYRLGKIKELCSVDVEAPDKRFAVELAINLHKLTHGIHRTAG